MSDQPTVTADEQHIRAIVREEVAAAVKAALADYATRIEVGRMIEDALRKQGENFNAVWKSVDEHMRQNEHDTGLIKASNERIAGVLDGVAATVKASAAHLDNLQNEVTDQSERIMSAHERIDRYAKAVFGDPDTPGVTSLVENFSQRRQEANEQFATTNRRLDELVNRMDTRIVPLERYVITHQQFEQRIVNTFRWFVNHPRVTIAIVGVLASGLSLDAIRQILETITSAAEALNP